MAPTASSKPDFNYVIIIFGHLSKALSTNVVESYLKSDLAKATSKLPPGTKFTYTFGTQYGLPTMWLSGSATIETFHLTFHGAFGYGGKKFAGAEIARGIPVKGQLDRKACHHRVRRLGATPRLSFESIAGKRLGETGGRRRGSP